MSEMEIHVRERYTGGAQAVEPALCCPVSYDPALLTLLPAEIVERDYGCGDPSRYVRPGDVVLDLGSGGGKICYMAAHLTGPQGRVIGVDMNDAMLALARQYQPEMAAKLGGDRVSFRKGRIQDLALDLDRVSEYLRAHPVTDLESADAFRLWQETQRRDAPMIPDNSVDLVISNCVLNLVDDALKSQLVAEIFRVLKPGGRVAISDIVSDAPIPAALKQDPTLWSGCISGAFEEGEFVRAFQSAGFCGVRYEKWDEAPWQVVEGIEFRSVTLTAVKRPVSVQTERGHAVLYRGPFACVEDELGNRYPAGERIAVSQEVYERLGQEPFTDLFVRIAPARLLLPSPFTAPPGTRRPASQTRGGRTVLAQGCCPPGGGCC